MDKPTCNGLTQRKIQCRRPIFANGHCRGHQDQYLENKQRREKIEKFAKERREKFVEKMKERKPIFDSMLSNFLESDYIILDKDEICPISDLHIVFQRYMYHTMDRSLINVYNKYLWDNNCVDVFKKYGIKFIETSEPDDKLTISVQGCCINYLNTIISLNTSKESIYNMYKPHTLVAMQL